MAFCAYFNWVFVRIEIVLKFIPACEKLNAGNDSRRRIRHTTLSIDD